ncbi:DMT family transporter [Carboxylicivirga mesophila]|uniref:DMT family transporter n=1 Tax=Carboxylicivirga mesophila TaxID=1166478 RepID=A0ABS5KEH0_9BACT|nr:DMT family transporter [Carboxylicivirga mesophila]MBS2213444.1 DMT family transporter [Carboxylicivirga mesophila]
MQKEIVKNTLLAIIACLLWSTAFVGIKIGLKYTTPLQFAGLRFFISGLLLLPLVPSFSKLISAIRQNLWLILKVSAFQTFILYALFYWGVDMIDGALAAIIIGSQPLFAALTAHVMMQNDKMSLRKLLIISSGIGGIVLIALPKGINGPNEWTELLGMALLVLANIASGIGNVVVSKNRQSISPVVLNASQMIFGGLLLFVASLFTEPFSGFVFPGEYYAALGWLSFLSATAFSIWFFLLQKPNIKVSDLNIFKFIIPVFGATLSWLILPDESPDIISIAGMLIIGASVVLYSLTAKS